MRKPAVAVVGATGAVGLEIIQCLERRGFPLKSLRLLASHRSAGKRLAFGGRELPVEALTPESFSGVELAFFSAGSGVSREFAPLASRAGAVVIDNSSAFRLEAEVPLVIPEVNGEAAHQHRGIIANPNCSTIIAMTPLWAIHRENPILRITAATYQAASGAGAAGMQELKECTRAELAGKKFPPAVFPHPYAFNLFSHNSPLDTESGYNEEELKMLFETRKIFSDSGIRVSATCVRVPVLRAHSIALHFECERSISPEEVREILSQAPGVRLVDNPAANHFPMPVEASGADPVLVGRIRRDISDPSGKSIALFVSGDQLLKGAALNAVQIGECLLKKKK